MRWCFERIAYVSGQLLFERSAARCLTQRAGDTGRRCRFGDCVSRDFPNAPRGHSCKSRVAGRSAFRTVILRRLKFSLGGEKKLWIVRESGERDAGLQQKRGPPGAAGVNRGLQHARARRECHVASIEKNGPLAQHYKKNHALSSLAIHFPLEYFPV